MTKISIIVPVYNTGKYLKECLASLAKQTLGDIEVLVIENNIDANTRAVIDQYISRYQNFKTYNKSGTMPGGAKNEGIKQAAGEYILFLDTNDQLAPDACQKLYNLALENNYDIVTCDSQIIDSDGKLIDAPPSQFPPKQQYSSLDLLQFLSTKEQAWGHLIKKSVFTDNNLLFPGDRPFEDTALSYTCFILARKIGFIKEKLILRHTLAPVISDPNKMIHPISVFKNFEQMRSKLITQNIPPEVMEEFEYNLLKMISGGEQEGSGTISELDEKHFKEFTSYAAPFYAKLSDRIFKKRNFMFRLKYFFFKTSLKYNTHWLPKIAKPIIKIAGYLYYPVMNFLNLFTS